MDEEIAKIVERHGWFAAEISDAEPPFLYSIGLMSTHKHPELIVFGLDSDEAYALVAAIIDQIKSGKKFTADEVFKIPVGDDTHRIGFRQVDETQHALYLSFAMSFMRRIENWPALEAMQVFWPDSSGKFPFEANCNLDVFRLQPRLDIALTPDETEEFEREFGGDF